MIEATDAAGNDASTTQFVTVEPRLTTVADALSVTEIVYATDYDPIEHAEILRLYQAIFDRSPDLEGAKYWIDINNQGFGMLEIAGFMSVSEEWATRYDGTADAEFVAAVYENVLGRDFDQGGFEYWLDLVRGTNEFEGNNAVEQLRRHEMVFYVTANPEFTTAFPFQPLL